MNWCFTGVPSIRGHTAILCIKCANTRTSWCFPCPTKRSPIDIVKFFIHFLAKAGIIILQVSCKLLHINNITLQTTGGYSSDWNGNVEVFNKTLKRGAGALLANAGLTLPMWCYVTVHYRNISKFLLLNHDGIKTAFGAWYNQKPNWRDFRVFGCDIYVMNENDSKILWKRLIATNSAYSLSWFCKWENKTGSSRLFRRFFRRNPTCKTLSRWTSSS